MGGLPYVNDNTRLLDIGAGQYAVISNMLFSAKSDVLDIDTRFKDYFKNFGIGFLYCDLSKEVLKADNKYSIVVMSEVIEHIPTPPYIVFNNISRSLVNGGLLIITTPNLYRFRNLVRMFTGKKIFDTFQEPSKDKPLGHFLEYSIEHLEWHVEKAGFTIVESKLTQLDYGASTKPARIFKILIAPLQVIRPLWRDSIFIVAKKTSSTGNC